ncbi:MAG: sigma 54-interacting transcriptional regulator [Cytophagales bacterium]|nr:sigma 54-interacting transcriptional regulator [Bernardetiaceae bacterium]MDW8211088.1 sigma 54-interacting transcriptional regulator [Cytophagales bacterium]
MINSADIQAIKQRFGIIGNSPALNYAIQVAIQVAPTDLTVLITGESGSGKESFSKIIHNLSPRKHNTFIAINCGAIPEGTINSELFGHEKGSFTGATEARKGYFEVTDGGTIFLDEIGEMPLETQARLLRVLENGEFIRVGSSKVQKTNVRVVAATNVDLLKAAEQGKFRLDLYYRLNTVPIHIPPLRERGEDIILLFRKFAADFAERYRTQPVTLNEEAKQLLLNYPFPGNIRQLKNIAEQISLLEINRHITAETLAKYLPPVNQHRPPVSLLPTIAGELRDEQLSERDLLYKILFDLRRDVNDLKKIVLSLLQGDVTNQQLVVQQNQRLFGNLEVIPTSSQTTISAATITPPANTTAPVVISSNPPVPPPTGKQKYETEHIEDIPHEIHQEEEESLSLEKKEKEMIIKALIKNNHRRKYAAQDLGISERTLYRKIKQYGIEEL